MKNNFISFFQKKLQMICVIRKNELFLHRETFEGASLWGWAVRMNSRPNAVSNVQMVEPKGYF